MIDYVTENVEIFKMIIYVNCTGEILNDEKTLVVMLVSKSAWKLRTLQGYRMTKPVEFDISHTFFIDN